MRWLSYEILAGRVLAVAREWEFGLDGPETAVRPMVEDEGGVRHVFSESVDNI
jgi:hypothetical protein